MATTATTLTGRQREVLDAIGSRDAVSAAYVSRAAGEQADQPSPITVSGLIVLGLVERCYSATMLRLTYAGRESLDGPPATRPGWVVDGSAYRRAGVLFGQQTYGAYVQLDAAIAPEQDRPWLAYCVVSCGDDREWPPVTRSSWHVTAGSALDALDTYIDGLVAQ